MFSNKVFQLTLLISLITHGVILFQNHHLNLFPTNKKENNLEISYIKNIKKETKEYPKNTILKKEPRLKLPTKITLEKRIPLPFIDKEDLFRKSNTNILPGSTFTKPAFIKPDIIAIKKKITLPPINIDKIDNPSYISYYQIVREKIRRAAYQNYTHSEVGKVYLSFIISNDGYLKEIRLVEEKSSTSPYLREIALQSIKDASPYPTFPKELDYLQLSFNVVISFEIE